jgi:hypothetical protein
MKNTQTRYALTLCFAFMAACGGDSNDDLPVDAMMNASDAMWDQDMGSSVSIDVVEGCDPLQPDVCAFPWPSSYYLATDETTTTGYRLTFGEASLPASLVSGEHMNPAPFQRYDGFGLGSQMYTLVPNLDGSNLPDETNISASIGDDSPVMLIEIGADGHRRVSCWVEMDVSETEASKRALFINPAELLKPNHQYVVVLRNLVDLGGDSIQPTPALQILKDNMSTGTPLESRQAHFDALFEVVTEQGVTLDDVQVLWDFHTASEASLHNPVLSLWSKALEVTGEDGPELIIDDIEQFLSESDGSDAPVHPHIAYRIQAHITVPRYVRESEPAYDTVGWILNEDENGVVTQNGTMDVPILIGVPRSAVSGTPQTLLAFGHGNFNDRTEGLDLDASGNCGLNGFVPCRKSHSRMYDTYGLTYFATDMLGMSATDYDTTIPIMLLDLSLFPWLSDYLHQGMLNRLLATRSMHRQFGVHTDIMDLGVTMADTDVRYWGISGGAILGGSFAALSPDVSRAALSVFGMNWVSVLWRSRQFLPLFTTLMTPYPNRLDQIVTFGSLQILWDPTDSVNYMHNLVDAPITGHPVTQVLVDVTEGDQSVPPVLAENLSRSKIGIPTMVNYDDERVFELIDPPADYPRVGSGITVWHTTAPWSQIGNQPPMGITEDDPHGHARQFLSLHDQIAHFFSEGEIKDVCDGGTCPSTEEIAPYLEGQ